MKFIHKFSFKLLALFIILFFAISCKKSTTADNINSTDKKEVTAKDILGNNDYQAMSYGGYRHPDHSTEPTLEELKEDMKLLSAMGIKIIRTYKVHLPQASNILKAISELKKEDPDFEMYVMLGAWIDCKNAWTELEPDHNVESEANKPQIEEAVRLANQHPDIVKIIAVGNEAMVKWAAPYYVQPGVILKWVNHLQELKKEGKLPMDMWITSSDNFASWGGGDEEYHVVDLEKLIKAVDYISLHTYPMHDTHYNPDFWGITEEEAKLTDEQKIHTAMKRAQEYAEDQYNKTVEYIRTIDTDVPVHIGETGWASESDGHYGPDGSHATDEYKEALYHKSMRKWTDKKGISCFYFEAFDEPWKGGNNPGNSEKHFGLITVDGKAKYAMWDLVDKGVFEGLTRGGNPISKTFGGDKEAMFKIAMIPPVKEVELEPTF